MITELKRNKMKNVVWAYELDDFNQHPVVGGAGH